MDKEDWGKMIELLKEEERKMAKGIWMAGWPCAGCLKPQPESKPAAFFMGLGCCSEECKDKIQNIFESFSEEGKKKALKNIALGRMEASLGLPCGFLGDGGLERERK